MNPATRVVAVVALSLAGCGGSGTTILEAVSSPGPTPPLAAMDAHFPSGRTLSVTSATPTSQSTTVDPSIVVTLIASATDPDGVRDVQIWVEETWWRVDPGTGIGTQEGPGFLAAPEKSSPDDTASVGNACTSRTTVLHLDLPLRRRNATNYRARVWATGVNLCGASATTGDLTLTWP
jgi:hypothetical protein